jgi:hypothetical protein
MGLQFFRHGRWFFVKFLAFVRNESAWKSVSDEVLVALAVGLGDASLVQPHLSLELSRLSRVIVDD